MSIGAQDTLNQIQNNTAMVQYQQGQRNLGSSEITREGFLRLIMAQMQYQDPTEPQDATQMLAQQVQLQQVQQGQEMVNATKFSQAASMVGKVAQLVDAPWDFTNGVSGTPEYDAATGAPKTTSGVIESVQFDQQRGKALVQIGGKYYDADNILNLYNDPASQTSSVSNSGNLVGRTAQVIAAAWNPSTGSFDLPGTDPATSLPNTVTGQITSILFDPGLNRTLVQIGGKYYDAGQILQITNGTGQTTTASN